MEGTENRLEVKVFGGAKLYEGGGDIGASNAQWVLEYLDREGLRPIASDLGRDYARSVYFYTDTGRVLMKSGDSAERGALSRQTKCSRPCMVRTTEERRHVVFDRTLSWGWSSAGHTMSTRRDMAKKIRGTDCRRLGL